MHKQERCVYCKEWYPKPVSYHHSTEECRANEAALSNDKHRESPHEPPMVYDPQRGVMVKPGRSRSSKPWDGAPLTDAIWQRHTTDASALEGPARELEHYYEMASHACQLERKLAEARANADDWMRLYGSTQGHSVAPSPVSQSCQQHGCRFDVAQAMLHRAQERGELSETEVRSVTESHDAQRNAAQERPLNTNGGRDDGLIGPQSECLSARGEAPRVPAAAPLWENAAMRFGEKLAATGPDGYYSMTLAQWLDWCESRVTQSSSGSRSFPICKDHEGADWNQPALDDDACVLCRLFYLEAQECLLEEWQQRADRAEGTIAEIKRPLDEQMARLNATVTQLNADKERLERELAEATAAFQQEADIRTDRENVMDAMGSALGVSHEPHQTYMERLVEAASITRSATAPAWIEEELKDGDRICEAAGVQRTEGGRLPVQKIINAIKGRPVQPHRSGGATTDRGVPNG